MMCGYTPVDRVRKIGKIACDLCKARQVGCIGLKTKKNPEGGDWPLWERRPGHTSAAVDRLTQVQHDVLDEITGQSESMRKNLEHGDKTYVLVKRRMKRTVPTASVYANLIVSVWSLSSELRKHSNSCKS